MHPNRARLVRYSVEQGAVDADAERAEACERIRDCLRLSYGAIDRAADADLGRWAAAYGCAVRFRERRAGAAGGVGRGRDAAA